MDRARLRWLQRAIPVAWLVNWLPPVAAMTYVVLYVYGMWALLSAPHLPPAPVSWVLGTIWVTFALYAAIIASSDCLSTVGRWEQQRALKSGRKAQHE